jgi:hypothetical protein
MAASSLVEKSIDGIGDVLSIQKFQMLKTDELRSWRLLIRFSVYTKRSASYLARCLRSAASITLNQTCIQVLTALVGLPGVAAGA